MHFPRILQKCHPKDLLFMQTKGCSATSGVRTVCMAPVLVSCVQREIRPHLTPCPTVCQMEGFYDWVSFVHSFSHSCSWMKNDRHCYYQDESKSTRIRFRIEMPRNKSPSCIQETAGFPDGPHSLSRIYESFLSFFVELRWVFASLSFSLLCHWQAPAFWGRGGGGEEMSLCCQIKWPRSIHLRGWYHFWKKQNKTKLKKKQREGTVLYLAIWPIW